MTRNELKQMWFNLPTQTKITKTIIVKLMKDKFNWKNCGDVKIIKDDKSGYHSFSTFQKNPVEYALNTKEYKSGKYQLVIK